MENISANSSKSCESYYANQQIFKSATSPTLPAKIIDEHKPLNLSSTSTTQHLNTLEELSPLVSSSDITPSYFAGEEIYSNVCLDNSELFDHLPSRLTQRDNTESQHQLPAEVHPIFHWGPKKLHQEISTSSELYELIPLEETRGKDHLTELKTAFKASDITKRNLQLKLDRANVLADELFYEIQSVTKHQQSIAQQIVDITQPNTTQKNSAVKSFVKKIFNTNSR